jgi:hypothetical protein
MKVLVATPVMRGELMTRAWLSWYQMDWDGQLDFYQVIGGDDASKPYDNVVRKYNEIRQVVLSNGYDALMTVESDMIVPKDALRRLAAVDADVAYGLYVWRHGIPFWTAYTELKADRGTPISMYPERAKEAWGQVIDVQGVGHGCTLIHRQVLEAMIFKWEPGEFGCCDWHMALDCLEMGLTQKCDLGVVCGHIATDPVARILWPDPEARGLYRADLLEDWPNMKAEEQKKKWYTGIDWSQLPKEQKARVEVLHRFHLHSGIYHNPGEVIEVSRDVAERLVKRRLGRLVKKMEDEEPKLKVEQKAVDITEELEPGWRPKDEGCWPCGKKKARA